MRSAVAGVEEDEITELGIKKEKKTKNTRGKTRANAGRHDSVTYVYILCTCRKSRVGAEERNQKGEGRGGGGVDNYYDRGQWICITRVYYYPFKCIISPGLPTNRSASLLRRLP